MAFLPLEQGFQKAYVAVFKGLKTFLLYTWHWYNIVNQLYSSEFFFHILKKLGSRMALHMACLK